MPIEVYVNLAIPIKHPEWGGERKGASAMAKLHARPSNQYRYEHYDPIN